MQRKTLNSVIFLCLLTCSGCAAAKVSLPAFHHTLARGEYRSAKKLAEGEIGSRNTRHNVLWNLQAAATDRLLKQYASSNAYFDRAEESFRYYDQQLAAGKSAQTSAGILFNDSAMPYTGKNYDRIMVNTYKALNYAVLGDAQNARVEFNRALQRQNDAKTLFNAQAESLKKQLSAEKEGLGPGREVVETTLNNPKLDRIINEKYKNLDEFKVFADFVNPFATYMAGLFFWLEGDTAKAVDILKEAYAMSKGHKVVASDFARAARGDVPLNELWIVYENGLAPLREEMRIDIPVFLKRESVMYIGTAFPNLTPGQEAYPFLSLSADSGAAVPTETLASMDNIIITEFKKELPGIIIREVSRVALKTYFQYKMQNTYGTLAGIASGIYQAATTAVDIRTWSALPKNFQLAHSTIPANRKISLRPSSGKDVTINIPSDCNNVIVYIRVVASGVEPVYDFIKF